MGPLIVEIFVVGKALMRSVPEFRLYFPAVMLLLSLRELPMAADCSLTFPFVPCLGYLEFSRVLFMLFLGLCELFIRYYLLTACLV